MLQCVSVWDNTHEKLQFDLSPHTNALDIETGSGLPRGGHKCLRADVLYGLVNLMGEARQAPSHLISSVPILYLHGEKDQVIPPAPAKATIAELGARAELREYPDGYHMLLFQNGTKMPYAVAATAWDNQLGCKTMNPKVFDALRTFREAHIDKGPEVVP